MIPYSVRLVIRRPEAETQTEAGLSPDAPFEARWVDSDGQMSKPFPLSPPLLKQDTADLRWYLEKYHEFVGAGTQARAHRIEKKLQPWGRALFNAIFAHEEGTHVYRNLLEAEKADQPILLTLGSTESAVLVQPWELMRSTGGPLAFRGVSIRRQLEGARPRQKLELRLPLRLLLIVSRPQDSGFIDPRTSVRPLLDGLDSLPRGSVEVELCEPPTLGELNRRISQARKQKRPFHIVHFDGHGAYLPETGVGALVFETEERKKDLVKGRQLGDLLYRLEVPLAILEACQTSDLSDQPVFGSVAPALLESGVGSVLAYSHTIHIEASRILVESFYRELADGLTVGQALTEARTQMRAEPGRWLTLGPNPPTVKLQDWFVPQLYQVGPDLSLLADGAGVADAEPSEAEPVLVSSREERLHGFPPEPTYRFQGRARELLELGRAFEKHHAVVVAGMGGMGKTALSREAAAWWLRVGRFEEAVFCSFEQVRSVDRVVQLLGQAVEGLDFARRPAEEQLPAAVQLFRSRRILLVWDNFESTLPQYQDQDGAALHFEGEEVQRLRAFYTELTRGRPEGRLLVTCRPADTGLPRIKKQALEGLARHDSLHLLTAIGELEDIDLEREGYERPQIEKLLDALADHPLSISLVTPHLTTWTPVQICTDFNRLLERFENLDAEEGRNRSLRASLEFSSSRLSEEARDVLPWLAWFQGGAFENQIRSFTGLEAESWVRVRQELESTALVRVEELPIFNNPFIRFHPTLSFAASADKVPDREAAEQRFVAVYLGVSQEIHGALFGQTAAAGMELMAREEGNVRAAIHRAFHLGERNTGSRMADTLQIFLQMAGRRMERDRLAEWVRKQMDGAGLDEALCASIRSQAQAFFFGQGQLQEAEEILEALIARLETEGLEGGEDPSFQIGTTYSTLGQILNNAQQPEKAIGASQKAIEALQDFAGDYARANRSAALGTQASALTKLGRLERALKVAEQGVAIDEELELHRNAAAGQVQIAQVLMAQGRHGEADARYEKALALARQVNDLELQGTTLQHQGNLWRERGDFGRSVELFQEAVRLFQRANDRPNEMRTFDLLASTESLRGHFDAAEAWYAKSRELAEQLGDRPHLAVIAQNIGILLQKRAEQAEDPREKETLLRRAVASIEASLVIHLDRDDQVAAASSYSQLGIVHILLGDLAQAEEQALRSLEIRENLGLPEVWKDYASLVRIADARDDAEALAKWTEKRDSKLAELRSCSGDQRSALSERATKAFLGLAQEVYTVRISEGDLPAEVAEVLAQLESQPEPLATAGVFLRAVASGGAPSVPGGLPEPLPKIFEGLLASLH